MLFTFTRQKFWQRFSLYLMPTMITVFILVLTITFLRPRLLEIWQAQKELGLGQERFSRLSEKEKFLSSQNQNELRERFKITDSALPSEKDIPGFLIDLGRLSRQASISVELIDLSAGLVSTPSAIKSQTSHEPQIVTAKVTIKGSFANIRDFLDKVVNSRRLLNIKGISLSGTEAQRVSDISLSLNFSIFFQLLPETLGEISQLLPQITEEEERIYKQIANFPLYSSLEQEGGTAVPTGKTDLFR